MSIDRLLALISALAVAIVLLLGGGLMLADEKALLSEAQQREIDKTAVVFTAAIDQAATLSATHSELLATDPTIRPLLEAGDRAGLQAYARPILDRLKNLAGIDVIHFHDPQMKSLLRVWDPDNFGQDLSTYRPMVVAANRSRQTQKGLEVATKGLSLRAISAVMDGDRLIGTVEAGVSLQSLADLAKSVTGGDYALVLDPQYVRDQNTETAARNGLVLNAATDRALFEKILAGGNVILSRSSYLFDFSTGDRTLSVQGKPLIDYSGNMIGTILTTCDFSDLQKYANRSLVTLISVCLGGLLIIFAIIMVTIRMAIIAPLRDLKAKVTAGADLGDEEPTSGLKDFRDLQTAVAACRNTSEKPAGKGG